VPAGHDQFPLDLVRRVLGDDVAALLAKTGCCPAGVLNMTHLALFFSRYVNGVAMRHGEVSRGMFPQYPINSITNGVHAATWASPPFEALFDKHVPEWRRQNLNLRYAISIPPHEVRLAHDTAKQALIAEVARRTGVQLAPQLLTLGFARRATVYKRADLLFSDLDRLRRIDHEVGALQVVYSGKAHPRDEGGKSEIRRVFAAAAALGDTIPVVYIEDYDMSVARMVCAGVDVWLNTPQRPQEASGTSGMKAALNGVPSLSVLDGWWIEGHVEGVTGWAIGDGWGTGLDPRADAASLYDKLEHAVLPTYYGARDAWDQVTRAAIALNGSFFNAERMMFQYAENAYAL
jgi:starch phosphorylase